MRISNLTRQEASVSDEKITDSLLDLSVYAILMKIYLEQKEQFYFVRIKNGTSDTRVDR